MVSQKRRIKLFSRLLHEFLAEYKIFYGKSYTVKVTEYSFLENFNTQVKANMDKYFDCDKKCLKNITLCKNINLHTTDIDINSKYIWKYLHNLYFITLEIPDETLINKSKERLANMNSSNFTPTVSTSSVQGNVDILKHLSSINFQNIAKNLENSDMMDGNTDMGNLINDIAGQVTKQLDGKDLSSINPMDFISSMMSGNTSNIGGIDFSSILRDTTEKIQSKVNAGELDLDKLRDQAQMLIGNEEIAKQLDI